MVHNSHKGTAFGEIKDRKNGRFFKKRRPFCSWIKERELGVEIFVLAM